MQNFVPAAYVTELKICAISSEVGVGMQIGYIR